MDTTKPAAALLSNQRDEQRHQYCRYQKANQPLLIFVHFVNNPIFHGLNIGPYITKLSGLAWGWTLLFFTYSHNAVYFIIHFFTI